jgi:hypothetical protein
LSCRARDDAVAKRPDSNRGTAITGTYHGDSYSFEKEEQMRIRVIGWLGALSIGLAGCVTDKTVLTNDRGRTKTCETKGRIGIVSGMILHERQKHCVDEAKVEGYKEAVPTTPTS